MRSDGQRILDERDKKIRFDENEKIKIQRKDQKRSVEKKKRKKRRDLMI